VPHVRRIDIDTAADAETEADRFVDRAVVEWLLLQLRMNRMKVRAVASMTFRADEPLTASL